jgi:hypothetical protein
MQIAGNHIIQELGQEVYQGGNLKISWSRIRTILLKKYTKKCTIIYPSNLIV